MTVGKRGEGDPGIFVFGDLHLGNNKAPGAQWAMRAMTNARERGAVACICLGDLVDRKALDDASVRAQAVKVMAYAEALFDEAHYIAGNHDATLAVEFSESVVVHSTKPHAFYCAGAIVHTAAVEADPDLRELSFPRRERGGEGSSAAGARAHLGVLHTSAHGAFSKQPCLPMTLGKMLACDYDGWILAHVHKPYVLNEEPFVGWVGMGAGAIFRIASLTVEHYLR